jgi:uncharacterized membrane protein
MDVHCMDIMKYKVHVVIAILAFIALAFSVMIEVEKQGLSGVGAVCTAVKSDCAEVQGSAYGKTLGIDNPYYGMVGFSLLIILSLWQYTRPKRWRFYLIAAGVFLAGLVALWFLYLQAFVLSMYCVYCLFVDVIALVLVVLAMWMIAKRQYL